ncbi:MAG: DUF5698 domain-containing protein [bacterium]
MLETFIGALLIMGMRICDVTIGTFRTILVVHGKKYFAAFAGFFEVLIWIFAMRYIVQHMDNVLNLIGYATGFALGNICGITVEEKVALGYVQVNVISKFFTDKIADDLRRAKFGVTILPAEGGTGGMSLIIVIIRRKDLAKVKKIIEKIDKEVFMTIQQSKPFRGFIHGSRK